LASLSNIKRDLLRSRFFVYTNTGLCIPLYNPKFVQTLLNFMTEPFLDVFSFVSIFAIGQAIFLIFLIFTKPQPLTRAKILSGIIMFVLAFMLTHHFLLHSRYLLQLPHFLGTGGTFIYLIGPLLYFYVRSLTKQKPWKWYDALHLLPFIYFNIKQIPVYLQPFNLRIEFLTNFYQAHFDTLPNLTYLLYNLPYQLHQVTYLAFALRLLYKYQQKIKTQFSNTDKISLQWMQTILYGYIIFIFIHVFAYMILVYFFQIFTMAQHVMIFILVLSVFIITIAYRGLQQSDFQPIKSGNENEKYKNSPLNQTQATKYTIQLIQMMEQEKLFTNPQLTLQMLAKKMEVNSNYISQVINEQLKLSFYDFVNGYRIEEAKKKLHSPDVQKYTIEAIAHQVGFNSKSTFNRAFKKHTELTPSQYRKKYNTPS